MSKRYPGVYRIICQETGDCYVGSSAYLQSRKSEHLQRLRKNEHANIHLQRAWNKYGEESFIFEILERPSVKELVEREQYWIDVLVPAYNIRKVAESNLGLKHSEATRAKGRQRWHQLSPEDQAKAKQALADGRQKRTEMIASGEWHNEPETIALIKAARAKQETTPAMLEALRQGQEVRKQVNPKPRLGMKTSEETRRKQSESAKRRPPISEETRVKQRASKLGKRASEESKRKRAETLKSNPRVLTEEQKQRIAETNRTTWAKKSVEEKHSYTQKRPPVSEVTRQRQSESAKNRRKKTAQAEIINQDPLF